MRWVRGERDGARQRWPRPGACRARFLELELGFRMGQTHRVLKETWERQIADLGLSAPLAAMLRAVCERPARASGSWRAGCARTR